MSYSDHLYGAVPALTTADIQALTTSDIQSLSTHAITPLSHSYIQPLTTADIASLGNIDLSALTSAWSIGGGSNVWNSGNISLTGTQTSGSYNLGTAAGHPYIYSSTGIAPWAAPNLSTMNLSPSGKINLTGPDADVVLDGISLRDTLSAIQMRLGMLVPDPEIEAEFAELRELSERYQVTLKKCQEQLKIVDILSQDDDSLYDF